MKDPQVAIAALIAALAVALAPSGRAGTGTTDVAASGAVGMGTNATAWTSTNLVLNIPTNTYCFPVGEKVHYTMHWGLVPVGTALFESDWVEEEGRVYLLLRMTAKTVPWLEHIYPVDDFIECLVDPDTFLPLRCRQKLKEGRRRRDEVTTFDYVARVARWEDYRKDETLEFEIDPQTRDILTFVYYMRTQDYDVGRNETFKVVVDEKVYDLTIKGIKEETVRLSKYGKVPCLEVEPEAKFGEIFVRKGRIWMWFSRDDRKVMTRMHGKVPMARVRTVLSTVEGPGDDDWVRKKR